MVRDGRQALNMSKALDIDVEDQRRKERPKRRFRKQVEEECGRFVQRRCVLHFWR